MGKYCPECYVGVNADDRICGNCGAVLKEDDLAKAIVISGKKDNIQENDKISQESIDTSFEAYQFEESIDEPERETRPVADKNMAPVLSLGDWMLMLLLLMLPIVNIVMLIIWSADSKTNPNKRHFAWAQLIYMGIIFVLSIIFSSIFAAIIIGAFSSMNF